MTKNEVKALIRKKMENAEKDYFKSFVKEEFEIHNKEVMLSNGNMKWYN